MSVLGAIKRIFSGERKPANGTCPECGAPVAFQEARNEGDLLYDVWNCPNGHSGDRGTEVRE